MSKNNNLRKLTYSAICVALAVVLSKVKLFEMPQGGSVTACSMLPVVLVGYWYGVRAGVTAGLAYGLLRLSLGGYVIHPIQLILDYLLAFALLGTSGFFRGRKFGLYLGYVTGSVGVFLCSFISGVVFFSEYAPEGQHIWVYSALYQLSYILPEMLITLLIISLPPVRKLLTKPL